MRIGLTTSVIDRGQSGIGRYVIALTQAFMPHAASHEFTLFVLEDDLPLFQFVGNAMRVVPVSTCHRSPLRNILWHQSMLPGLVKNLGLEVLHVPSYRRLLWPQPCALVGTIHDLAPFHLPDKYDLLRMFYGRSIARRLAQRQHQIIAVSHSTALDIVKHYHIPESQVTVVPNGVDHERFTPGSKAEARSIVAKRHRLQRPYFLYLARLEHPAKNHVRLLTAFERFKSATDSPWQLVFAGQDWHGAAEIHAAIRNSAYRQDIINLGFVRDGDLPDVLRAADVFVYPSAYEGFGLPPIEAMACGCPVICSTAGALKSIVGDAACLVDPGDTDGWQRQMTRMALDADLRHVWAGAGLLKAQEYDWQHTAAATLHVYSQAAAKVAAGKQRLCCG